MSVTEYESILDSAAALEAKGDCIDALNEYERAIDANHERAEAYLEAAKMLLRHDGIWKGSKQIIGAERAVQYLTDALSWDKSNLSALELLFHAEMHVGELHRAVQTASRLIDLSPDKQHWREQGRRTFASLQQVPNGMRLLAWSVGSEGINGLRKKFGE
ncbi:MAG: tetratricopeptide repeat protein [Chloroflexota bacterium]